MCQYRVDKHLIVLNIYSISISKILVTVFMTVKIPLNLKSKHSIEQKHSKTNLSQKTVKYKTNEKEQKTQIKVWNYKVAECLEI